MASERKAQEKKLSIFEKYLTGWVALCIIVGIFIGRAFPSFSIWLDKISIAQVPIMLMLVKICLATRNWFGKTPELVPLGKREI